MTSSCEEVPWVSILTPVANGWEYLEECARSIFSQVRAASDEDGPRVTWEWCVGINGHGLTGGEAMKMAEQIQRSLFVEEYGISMKVVNLPEVKGKVGALHALVGLSKGEWIALLDCDDKWAPHKLILQKIAVDSIAKEAGVIGTLCWYFGDWESEGPSLPSGWVPPAAFKEMNPIINSSAIMKREYALWTDEWWGLDDYELWLRLRSEGVKFYNIPLRLVYHRIHAASAFNSSGKQDVKGLISKYFKEEEC